MSRSKQVLVAFVTLPVIACIFFFLKAPRSTKVKPHYQDNDAIATRDLNAQIATLGRSVPNGRLTALCKWVSRQPTSTHVFYEHCVICVGFHQLYVGKPVSAQSPLGQRIRSRLGDWVSPRDFGSGCCYWAADLLKAGPEVPNAGSIAGSVALWLMKKYDVPESQAFYTYGIVQKPSEISVSVSVASGEYVGVLENRSTGYVEVHQLMGYDVPRITIRRLGDGGNWSETNPNEPIMRPTMLIPRGGRVEFQLPAWLDSVRAFQVRVSTPSNVITSPLYSKENGEWKSSDKGNRQKPQPESLLKRGQKLEKARLEKGFF